MVQIPSWAANWFAASQEIPLISRNPKVHHRTHKRPPPVSILGQPNPVHIPTFHLLEILPNIIHPSTQKYVGDRECAYFLRKPITSCEQTKCSVNPLTPNVPYRGRTAPLTSKVAFYIFIQQIEVLNILNMVYTLRFFLFKIQFVS